MYIQTSTERTTLAPLALDDAAFIQELLNSPGWIQNIGQRNIHSIQDAEAYIQKINDNENFYYHLLSKKDGGIKIGVVTFIKRPHYAFPDIGFALLPQYEGKGYAYEGAKAYLDAIQDAKLYKSVCGFTLRSNTASVQLLLKLGLMFEKDYEEDGEELSMYVVKWEE